MVAAAVAFAGTAVETQSKPPAAEPHTDHAAPPAAFNGRIALYKTAMGPFKRPISSRNSEAQAFFNQGFQLMYAFARARGGAIVSRGGDARPRVRHLLLGRGVGVGF